MLNNFNIQDVKLTRTQTVVAHVFISISHLYTDEYINSNGEILHIEEIKNNMP